MPFTNAELQQRFRRRLRVQVLTHYSKGPTPRCAQCPEDRIACLDLDHTNGEGMAHRRSIGIMSGSPFYQWIKKQGFPKGFGVLCANCHAVKSRAERIVRGPDRRPLAMRAKAA
jgi:hypothetical protein